MKFSATMLYDVFGMATFGMADIKSIEMFGSQGHMAMRFLTFYVVFIVPGKEVTILH